jgi:hypothetical protein
LMVLGLEKIARASDHLCSTAKSELHTTLLNIFPF